MFKLQPNDIVLADKVELIRDPSQPSGWAVKEIKGDCWMLGVKVKGISEDEPYVGNDVSIYEELKHKGYKLIASFPDYRIAFASARKFEDHEILAEEANGKESFDLWVKE
jgi:hypothetical protein